MKIKNICGRTINVEHKLLKINAVMEIKKKTTQEIKNLIKHGYIQLIK